MSGAGPSAGGTLKVNGHVVIVPANTIVILPANALTWAELFSQAPAPYGPTQTGMAMADSPLPLTTYEVHVVGNKVGNDYIAGLVDISQNALNQGAGYINYIDYAAGEIRVGGIRNDPSTGARVRINDPVIAAIGTGRYSRGQTPDKRFTVDQENPTIRSATGYPMCLPRVTADPRVTGNPEDPLCPQTNRATIVDPLTGAVFFTGAFTMLDPALHVTEFDAAKQAPFEIDDYVTFAGTLVTDDPAQPTVNPAPGTATTYISAHTITNNIAIYTAPGTNPAYIVIEVTLLGVGGTTIGGVTEATARTRFEGFSTDTGRIVHLYGIDVNCADGSTADRDWGTIDVDPGGIFGAVKGRWRFRPPSKVLTAPATFLPATRELRAVIQGAWVPPLPGTTSPTAANGLTYGQYHAPILEYIFPEQVIGNPPPPATFETFPFLASGGYASSAGTLAGQLNPWPGTPTPAPCTPPAVVAPTAVLAATPNPANAGATVTLNGTGSTGTLPLTFAWSQIITGTEPAVTLTGANLATATFTAPALAAPTTLTFQLQVTNSAGSDTKTIAVTINAAGAPGVDPIPPQTVTSGTPATLLLSGSPGPLTFSVVQTSGPAPQVPLTVTSTGTTTATATFTYVLPVGTPSATLSFSVTATNTVSGQTSAAQTAFVTVVALADTVTITGVEYRTGKLRLTVDASSSVVSPNVILTLQPYTTLDGSTVAGGVMTNTGGGLYQIILVGVPQPTGNITVTSNLGGTASSPLTRLRK